MGGFYGSVQLRTTDRAAVLAAAEAVARAMNLKCLVGPALNGWVGVYPEGNGQDHTVGEKIAAAVGGHGLHLLVHDDDVLAYWLWADGELVDRYWSRPGYFGQGDQAEQWRLVGDAERFAFKLDAVGRRKLTGLLDRGAGGAFESERLGRLGRLLGIRHAVQSFEYLTEDDGPAVSGRRFTLVPVDPTAEAAAAAERKAERKQRSTLAARLKAARKQQMATGLLLASDERVSGWPSLARVGDGLAVAWSGFGPHEAELTVRRSPWETGCESLRVPPLSNLAVCASADGGRLVANVGQAIRIWDRSDAGEWVDRATVWADDVIAAVAVSPDGARVAYALRSRVVLVDVDTPEKPVATFQIMNPGPLAFASEGDQLAMAGHNLRWIDLRAGTGAEVFNLLLGGARPQSPAAFTQAMTRRMFGLNDLKFGDARREAFEAAAALAEKRLEGLRLPAAELAAARLKMHEHLNATSGEVVPEPSTGIELARCVGFSGDGRWVWCGTDAGLRVFARSAIPKTGGRMPNAEWQFDMPMSIPPAPSVVDAVVEDAAGGAVVFGGGGGRVYRLDLSTGVTVQLVSAVPGGGHVASLALTADGSALAVGLLREQKPTRRLPAPHTVSEVQIWAYAKVVAQTTTR